MTSQRHLQAKEIFLEAIEKPPDQRRAFVSERCADDQSLCAEIEKLLQHHEKAGTQALLPQSPLEADRAGESQTSPVRAGDLLAEKPAARAARQSNDENETPDALTTGQIFAGRYRIVAVLGAGGMGRVYRAEDLTLGETVALKLIHLQLAGNPVWTTLFKNEARTARSVTHPNVCRIHDIGEAEGTFFISMEYLDGEDLAGLLRRIGRLPTEKAIDVARQICLGLDAVHRAGVIHRDLKPANVMLDGRGVVKLTDFGLAVLPGQIGAQKLPAGTPAYMAPEQITGKDVSPRSDVYALGLVIYEILSGRRAAVGESIRDHLEFHVHGCPPPLAEVIADINPEVEQVVMRCLAKAPEQRPRSCLEVAAALPGTDVLRMALEAGRTASPTLVALARPTTLAVARRRWVSIGTVALLLLLAIMRTAAEYSWINPGAFPPAALDERARSMMAGAGIVASDCLSGFADADTIRNAAVSIAGRDVGLTDFPIPGRPYFWRVCSDLRLPRRPSGVRFIASTESDLERASAMGAQRALTAFDPQMESVLLVADPPLEHFRNQAGELSPDLQKALLEKLLASQWGEATEIKEGRGTILGATGWVVYTGDSEPVIRADIAGRYGQVTLLVSRSNSNGGFARQQTGARFPRQEVVLVWWRVLFTLSGVLALPWAIRAIRTGNVDRSDVVRIGLVAGSCQFLALLLETPSGATANELTSALSSALVASLGVAAVIGLCYAAVEPLARRHWPDTMITLRRLLSGHTSDQAVRGHILMGVAIGSAWALLVAGERALVSAIGWVPRPVLFGERIIQSGLGLRMSLSGYLESVPEVLFLGVLAMLLLVVLLRLTRSRAAAAGLTTLLLLPLAMPQSAHPATGWLVVGLGVVGVAVWVILRFGVLATVSALFVQSVLNRSLLTLDSSSWFFEDSIALFVVVLAVLWYGTRVSSPVARTVRAHN